MILLTQTHTAFFIDEKINNGERIFKFVTNLNILFPNKYSLSNI